jgi:hypothetical protein
MAWWQRSSGRLFGLLTLIWLLLNLPVLLGIRVLPWDATGQFYPTVYFNAHSLRHGVAPWWNPYVYAGYPQIADPQGMMFSPMLMAWMLLPSDPGTSWFAWGVLLHVLMGGAAMLAVLRQLGANRFGALIGAVVYMGGGVAAARLEHVPIVIAYAYAPVLWLALRHFLAQPGWRSGVWLGLSAGALLTQLVQLTYLILLMLLAYGAVSSALRWRAYTSQLRWRWGFGLAVAALLALLVGLPQLLMTLAFATWSNRAALPLEASAQASLDVRVFLSLLNPNALHALRGEYSGPASLVEAFLYIGAVPSLLLVGVGAAWRIPAQRTQLLFFSCVAALVSVYMLGVHTSFYRWLYSWLPGIHLFRRPSDSAYLLNFSLAVCVGLASTHFRLDSRSHRTVLLAIATVWLLLSSIAMRGPQERWQVATIAAALTAGLATWVVSRYSTTRRGAALWMLAVLIADYRCFNLNGMFNQAHDNARDFRHNGAAAFIAESHGDVDPPLAPRVEPFDAGPHWDNLVVLWPLPSTQGYNPLRYALYDQWYGARENGNQPRPVTPFNPAPDSTLNNLLGVQYVVRDIRMPSASWRPPASYVRAYADDRNEVWQNVRAYHRLLTPVTARISRVGETVSPDDFARTNFNDELWLTPRDTRDRDLAEGTAQHCGERLHIIDAHATPTSIRVHTSSSDAGWLVLSDLDFPGWRATANGVELPIHRANGLFRAVCVPAGEQAIRFQFHPWAMVAAAWEQRRQPRAL